MEESSQKNWYLYILQCADGTLYTGITTDVERRFQMHCAGKGAKYTRGRGPLKIVYTNLCGTYSQALKEEIRMKHLSARQKKELCKRWKQS